MTPRDRKPFLEIVIGFAELKGKQLSAPALELYWNAMQHWSLQDFQAAANHLIRVGEFMPTPKDFEDLRKAGRQTATEIWLTVRRYMRWGLHGWTIDDDCPPMIAKCIQVIGGPNAIAQCDENKLHFLERRFVQAYEELAEVEDHRQAVPQIAHNPFSSPAALIAGFTRIGGA